MADDPVVTFRVDDDIDTSLSMRENIIEDILDCLKDISVTNGYNLDIKTNMLNRVNELDYSELPCNIVFDKESEDSGRPASWKHKLDIVIAYISADGDDTTRTLNKGISDVYKAIGKIEDRFCAKYSTNLFMPKSTFKDLVEKDRDWGEMDATISIEYVSPRWEL